MQKNKHFSIMTLGIAIFSMFFGAGNAIFPLAIGVNSKEQFTVSFIGLILTSIGAPLLGLYGALLYQGNCKDFFLRLGKWPGTFFILLLVFALGPIGAMPRCLTLTYSALLPIFPNLNLALFTAISVILILLCIMNRNLLLPILGKVLSPLLLIMLMTVAVYGIYHFEISTPSPTSGLDAFYLGLEQGYQTMDLLAAILFSITIWKIIQDKEFESHETDKTKMIYRKCILASLIAGVLLMLIYIGLGLAAKANMNLLQNVSHDRLLSTLSFNLMGPKLGIVANLTIALACFTTIISLTVAAVDVLWQSFQNQTWLSDKEHQFYKFGILGITCTTAVFTNLGFENICKIISTVVSFCYPALIALTLCNILNKKIGFTIIKFPVFTVLGITILFKIFFN